MVPCPACGTVPERRMVDPPPLLTNRPLAGFARAAVPGAKPPRVRKPRPPKPRPQVLSPYPWCRCGLFEVRIEDTGWLWSFGAHLRVRVYLRTGRSVRTHEPVAISDAGLLSETTRRMTREELREALDAVLVCSVLAS